MHLASWLNANKKFASVSWWTGRRKKHCLLGTMLSIAIVCTQPGNLIYLLHFPVFCDSKSILQAFFMEIYRQKVRSSPDEKIDGCMLGSEKKKGFYSANVQFPAQ